MKKILIIWTIVALMLVTGLTFLGMNINSKNREYYDLEKQLTEAAQDYYSQYPNELPASKAVITAEKLSETNFINELKYKNEVCKGYVVIEKNYLNHGYSSYIKCSKYQTKNYNTENEGVNL